MPQDLLLNEESKEPEQMIISHIKKLRAACTNKSEVISGHILALLIKKKFKLKV